MFDVLDSGVADTNTFPEILASVRLLGRVSVTGELDPNCFARLLAIVTVNGYV